MEFSVALHGPDHPGGRVVYLECYHYGGPH